MMLAQLICNPFINLFIVGYLKACPCQSENWHLHCGAETCAV